MNVLRAAFREFGWLVGGLTIGSASADEEDALAALPRRGALWVAVQTAATAVVAAVVGAGVLTVRALLGGRADALVRNATNEAGLPLLVFAAMLLVLPLALHWFAQPPRRGVGLTAGLVTTAVVAAPVLLLPQTPVWTGYALVTVAFVAGGAVFGAVSPKPASSRPDDAAVHRP